jgi:hypothetical protein
LAFRLSHPAFDPLRRWLGKLPDPLAATLEQLNALAQGAGVTVASGMPLRFVAPTTARGRYGDYELRVFESGCVDTRAGSRHDLFNALAWLAFPRTKAALNARHAAEIPHETGRRGRLRDLLTILDEGGALVSCADGALLQMIHEHSWKELFWTQRKRVREELRVEVLGHAVLEQALEPWPGITCKAVLLTGPDTDAQAAEWLAGLPRGATPRDLPPLPVFGLPGWCAESEDPRFYDDVRYFRGKRSAAPVPAAPPRGGATPPRP